MQTKRFDPLLCDFDLPLSATFYPAGFPLHLATNSRHVMEAAAESWAPFSRQADTPPMEFRVVVEPDVEPVAAPNGEPAAAPVAAPNGEPAAAPVAATAGEPAAARVAVSADEPYGEPAAAPTFRKQRHLLSFVSDAHNFATGDCLTLSANFHLSAATAADHAGLRWFYLEALAYMLLTQRYVVSLHAACVACRGAGILICGKSGAGKSTLSFACARAGFTYVSDDCTWLLAGSEDRIAIGKPHQVRFRHDAAALFPELAGYLSRVRPNGKRSIEVPTSLFPGMRTASRCPIRCLVFLNRENGGPAHAERMRPTDAAASLLAEMPSYGAEVNAMHEKTIQSLAELPAWRLRYRTLEEAIRLLSEIAVPPEKCP